MTSSDITLIVAIVGVFGSVLSLIVTVIIAAWNVRSAQNSASDEISAGASTLMKEYREARKRDKETIRDLEGRIDGLENWRRKVNDFIIPVFRGAHLLREQVIDLKGDPVYVPPDLPEWLSTGDNFFDG